MHFALFASSRSRHLVALLFFALAGLPACSKKSSTATAVTCPFLAADAGLPPSVSAGTATVDGSGVIATFCDVAVSVAPLNGQGPSSFLLLVDSTASATSSSVQAPASATAGTLTGSIGFGATTPGVYRSTDGTQCGSVTFSYGVPLASEAECAATDAQGPCATGCTFNQFCGAPPCCIPLATTYIFQASGAVDAATSCGRNQSTPLGSWTLTLSSVVPADAGDGQMVVVPHGSLDATLQGSSGDNGTVSLSLTF